MLLDVGCGQEYVQLMVETLYLVEHLSQVHQVVFTLWISAQAPLHQLHLTF